MIRLALAAALALAAPAARAAEENPGADGYAIDTAGSSAALKVGEKGRVRIAILPRAPWHVDPKAPLSIQLEATAGIEVAKAKLARADAVEPKAEVPRFEVPITARAAGAQETRAHLKFFLCRDTICVQQTKTLALVVAVR